MSQPPIVSPPKRPPQFGMKWLLILPAVAAVYLSIGSMIALRLAVLAMIVLASLAGLFWRQTRALLHRCACGFRGLRGWLLLLLLWMFGSPRTR